MSPFSSLVIFPENSSNCRMIIQVHHYNSITLFSTINEEIDFAYSTDRTYLEYDWKHPSCLNPCHLREVLPQSFIWEERRKNPIIKTATFKYFRNREGKVSNCVTPTNLVCFWEKLKFGVKHEPGRRKCMLRRGTLLGIEICWFHLLIQDNFGHEKEHSKVVSTQEPVVFFPT